MIDSDILLQVLDAGERRRAERRNFLRSAGVASLAVGGASLLSACGGSSSDAGAGATDTSTPTPSPSSTGTLQDQDTLNFALNLEYLEAQFYSYAVTGAGLPNALIAKGDGNQSVQGTVTGGRKVSFTDPIVQQYAIEIAADEVAHVAFLRSALGAAAVAMPSINIDGGANGAFSLAARAAGIATTNGAVDSVNGTFDPYASDENFLLGAFIFEDVGVTAYKGAAQTINTTLLLDAAAGILATEAYHAGLIRTVLYSKGLTTPSLRVNAGLISDARDSLDGSTDDDQGITGDAVTSNLVPADANGLIYGRTAGQVLNIVYLNKNAVVGGGFFPNGLNGTIRTSAAN
ncbi:ferritin-like domain-containing protein [Sphingomonas sp. PAMC 26605]|uniref:ferritin-like domain-containing protein n=1 Tax=Sphingomonas sp. PAMC 26605 TaxID=1112214 RepID=UPI00026CD05B|nr:ferritin-like domain-containing protein [Sphingomonas sp. PAMC 26605]